MSRGGQPDVHRAAGHDGQLAVALRQTLDQTVAGAQQLRVRLPRGLAPVGLGQSNVTVREYTVGSITCTPGTVQRDRV